MNKVLKQAGRQGHSNSPRLDALKRLSTDFLAIVSSYLETAGLSAETEQSLALWCLNQPPTYQKHVWDVLGISPVKLSKATDDATRCAIAKLACELVERDATCVFLMDDGQRLAEAYESLGGSPVRLKFGRSCLPPNRLQAYFRMFALVNDAALKSAGNWNAFLSDYQGLVGKLGRGARGMPSVRLLRSAWIGYFRTYNELLTWAVRL